MGLGEMCLKGLEGIGLRGRTRCVRKWLRVSTGL